VSSPTPPTTQYELFELTQKRAYALWEKRGKPLWDDQRDWFAAEKELAAQVQPGDLPDRFEGWELRYRIHGPYDQAFPGWARSVAAALRAQFPGATVTVETVAGPLASATVIAPEGTHEQQVAKVGEIARSVEEVLAQRAVGRTG